MASSELGFRQIQTTKVADGRNFGPDAAESPLAQSESGMDSNRKGQSACQEK